MEACPYQQEMEKLISGSHAPERQAFLEQHLETCELCRRHLEVVADVRSLVPARPASGSDRTYVSAPLQRAIEQLQADPDSRTGLTSLDGDRLQGQLPFLRPTERVGCLGRLGTYEIRRVIGRGGMGTVLEGWDPQLRRNVAIKVLPHLQASSAEARARFLREAQAAAALTHENIVTIHEVDEDHGVPYLVLQYVPGESLADRLRREGRLPLADVVRIGTQVARGLAAVHERSLIHRDIKPSNILLETGTGRAKIADFGLVKITGDEPLSASGTVAGTPEFMSPEQATGQTVDARSDLFSLGVVLYAASTGASPFHAETALLSLDRVSAAAPLPLNEAEPTLPAWFCGIVHQLMAKDPGQRIQTAQELARLLEQQSRATPSRVILGADQVVRPTSPLARFWRNRRRRWLIRASWIAPLVGLAIFFGIYLGNSEKHQPDPAPRPPPAAGFVIAGQRIVLQNPADALAAAQDNDVIEVYGDGPYLTAPLTIAGKRLTIRAMAGAQPVFLSKTPAARTTHPFLQTDSDLHLEGLTVSWSLDAPTGRTEADLLSRCIILANRGRLTVTNCRITTGQTSICLGVSGRDVVLQNCHCAADNGMALFWRPPSGGRLTAENCVFEGRVGLTIITLAEIVRPAVAMVGLNHNTFAVEKSLQLALFPGPKQPLDISARGNLFDNLHHCAVLGAQARRQGEAPSPSDMVEFVRAIAKWSDEGNVHRRGADYIVGQRPGGFLSAEVRSVDRWLKFWNLPTEQSVEGTIHFHKRDGKSAESLRLDRVDNASGPVPVGVGADAERLGPGAAYHASRAGR